MDTSRAMVLGKGRKPERERRYRTNAQKRGIVEETLRGEEPVAAVARRHGVNANLLFNWRKLYERGLLEQCRELLSARLVPVTVTEPADRAQPAGTITIEFSGEIRLRLEGRVDRESLVEVLTVLGAR
jgi:transposase